MTIKDAKKTDFQSPSKALDIACFLEDITGLSKIGILLNSSMELSAKQEETFLKYCSLRSKGLPVAYILKKKDFYGRTFYVNENVLIPKPDTEILVERALELIVGPEKMVVADICTGSGCIGLSVILEKCDFIASIVLSDISEGALFVAKKNWENLVCNKEIKNRINFNHGDLLQGLGQFDMILTNPPYVPFELAQDLLKDGRNEPLLALSGDITGITSDGLELPFRLLEEIKNHLKKGGVFLMELGEYNIEKARDYAFSLGFSDLLIHKDLEGQLRVLEGRL